MKKNLWKKPEFRQWISGLRCVFPPCLKVLMQKYHNTTFMLTCLAYICVFTFELSVPLLLLSSSVKEFGFLHLFLTNRSNWINFLPSPSFPRYFVSILNCLFCFREIRASYLEKCIMLEIKKNFVRRDPCSSGNLKFSN